LIRQATKPAKKLTKPAKKTKKARTMALKRRTTSATIEIARTSIEYTEGLSERAGCLTIAPGSPNIVPPNGDSLLHLLFFLIFTAEGGQLLAANAPSAAATPEVARANLKAALLQRFPTIGDDRLDAVIDAHFAADEYVAALEANDPVKKQAQEAIYSQKLLAILGELHDDAMAHEFSMRW
jgi:hypothetical protein